MQALIAGRQVDGQPRDGAARIGGMEDVALVGADKGEACLGMAQCIGDGLAAGDEVDHGRAKPAIERSHRWRALRRGCWAS